MLSLFLKLSDSHASSEVKQSIGATQDVKKLKIIFKVDLHAFLLSLSSSSQYIQ